MGLVIKEIELDKLFISPLNVRRDPGDLTQLTDSITDMGVLEPILVREMGERYEVIAGSRRADAARSAGQTTIPASVLELTNVQALLSSLIENIHRKDLTLEERVVTYQQLEALEPAYRNKAALANIVKRSPQKIGQELQAYEIALKLSPFGIRVESHFHLSSLERQEGVVLPEYHAVLLHQASGITGEAGAESEEAVQSLVALAKTLAGLSQAAAKAYIDALKNGQEPHEVPEPRLTWPERPKQKDAPLPHRYPAPQRIPLWGRGEQTGGLVTCACCGEELTLLHAADGTHLLTRQFLPPQDQPAEPDFSSEYLA